MNPVALVTGGGVRVGRAIALGLVESGYDLVVSYNSSATGAAEVATAAARLGRRVHPVQADLSREEDVVRLAHSVADRFGGLDLLVNSASSFVANDLLAVTVEEWDAVMAVNLRAPFLLVRETAALLRAARGSVVNIVDLSALQPWTSHPHHSVSKAGLLHLTKVMARALAPDVRVKRRRARPRAATRVLQRGRHRARPSACATRQDRHTGRRGGRGAVSGGGRLHYGRGDRGGRGVGDGRLSHPSSFLPTMANTLLSKITQ